MEGKIEALLVDVIYMVIPQLMSTHSKGVPPHGDTIAHSKHSKGTYKWSTPWLREDTGQFSFRAEAGSEPGIRWLRSPRPRRRRSLRRPPEAHARHVRLRQAHVKLDTLGA